MAEAHGELLDRARAALRAGDAAAAREAVEPLHGDEGCRGAVLEIRARADYLDLDFANAIAGWEQAYAAHRSSGEGVGAVRVARTIAGMYHSIVGDLAVSQGWLARAQTLLGDSGDRSERGWVTLNLAVFESDRAVKHERMREALTDGRNVGDSTLEVAALAYLGASLVHAGQVEEGMRHLDEALAAVAGEEVDDFCVVEEVFCQLFDACEHTHDIARADQWMRVGEAVSARRKLPAVSAFCCTHYGAVLAAAGRWDEADAALTSAVRLWGLGQRSTLLRGGALVRLADLRVRQGRLEEAAALLADLDPKSTLEVSRTWAAIHHASGDTAVAREVLEHALSGVDPHGAEAAPLIALLAKVQVADGDFKGAEALGERLDALAARHLTPYLRALAASARAELALASGSRDPLPWFRAAAVSFSEAQMPLEAAQARLELARALVVADQAEVARSEATAALQTFERLKAARHADAAASLLRQLGVRSTTNRQGDGVLTRREAEVLELLGHGLSNAQIGERLFISRKTVEHHVGNVLVKLGLRNRAEAAAHSIRSAVSAPREPASD